MWTEDGTFFNKLAVRRGYARAVLYEPNDAHIQEMRAAEAKARAADRGMWGDPCNYDSPPAQSTAEPESKQRSACAPGYDPCVPPYPPDVNCDDVNGPITVTGNDPHGLDADGDGVACES